MRGIEAALSDIRRGRKRCVRRAEALRKLYTNIAPSDRVLTATLVYCSLRRQGLWKHLLLKYCKRNARELPVHTANALIIGIAGIVELRYFALPVLINAVVQAIKAHGDERDIALVNAVLHTVADEAKDYLLELKKRRFKRFGSLLGCLDGLLRSGQKTLLYMRRSALCA